VGQNGFVFVKEVHKFNLLAAGLWLLAAGSWFPNFCQMQEARSQEQNY
jgi:hypothetical protein